MRKKKTAFCGKKKKKKQQLRDGCRVIEHDVYQWRLNLTKHMVRRIEIIYSECLEQGCPE